VLLVDTASPIKLATGGYGLSIVVFGKLAKALKEFQALMMYMK
jgi:hypothetical protein